MAMSSSAMIEYEKAVSSKGVWSQLIVRRVTRRDFDYETKLIHIRVRVTSIRLLSYSIKYTSDGDCGIFDYALNFSTINEC